MSDQSLNMTYRDNEAVIRLNRPLQSGRFTVKQLSITNGQDPEERNKVGDQKNITSNGTFNFSVGRKGSTQVALWWKDAIEPGKCTFNKYPDDLNFAFAGELELTFKVNQQDRVYRFEDVYIAQGHAGTSNNWWFGGKYCKWIASDTVACDGIDVNSGAKVTVNVRRGGNSVNEFTFTVR